MPMGRPLLKVSTIFRFHKQQTAGRAFSPGGLLLRNESINKIYLKGMYNPYEHNPFDHDSLQRQIDHTNQGLQSIPLWELW